MGQQSEVFRTIVGAFPRRRFVRLIKGRDILFPGAGVIDFCSGYRRTNAALFLVRIRSMGGGVGGRINVRSHRRVWLYYLKSGKCGR